MSEFNAGTIKSTADINAAPFHEGLDGIERRGERFARRTFTARADVNTRDAERKLDRLERKARDLRGGSMRVDLAGDAEQRMDALQRQATMLSGRPFSLEFDADTDTAHAELRVLSEHARRVAGNYGLQFEADTTAATVPMSWLERRAQELDNTRPKIMATADVEVASFQMAALRAITDQVDGSRATVQGDADVAAAIAELEALKARVAELEGRRVNIPANVQGGNRASLILSAIVAGLGAIGYAAPAAAAALAAVPQALTVAAGGVGALFAGLNGVGEAYSALGEAAEQSAQSSGASAAQQQAQANQIRGAIRGVESAQIQADRARITSAQQVADARRSLARAEIAAAQAVEDAERSLERARQAAARSIEDAERSLARARESAAERTAAANDRYEASVESLERAQENLNDAFAQGREDLEDFQLQLEGGALSQERATLRLEQARERMREGMREGVTGTEYRELSLAVREAEHSVKVASERMGDLREEEQQWADTGVEGSQAVVTAREQLEQQEEAVAAAAEARQQAERDGARQIEDAERQLSRARSDGARQVADAERSLDRARTNGARQVADAERALDRARQQAAWSQADAARSLEAAQERLAQAYQDTGSSAQTAMDKAAAAMAKLTPEGRAFVRMLDQQWRPALRGVGADVQRAMLPKLTTSMEDLLDLMPDVSDGLALQGSVLGDVAVAGADMMTSGPFRADFRDLMESNAQVLGDLGLAGVDLTEAMFSLSASTGPLVERFSANARESSAMFNAWLEGKQQSGELDQWLGEMGDRLAYLWQWTKQVVGGAWDLSTALAPVGQVVLKVTGALAEFIGNTAKAHPTLVQLAAGAFLVNKTIGMTGIALGAAASKAAASRAGWAALATNLGNLRSRLAQLGPTALAQSTAMQRLGGAATTAATKVGVSTTSATRFGSALTRVGGALPMVGLAVTGAAMAYDALTTSTSEASSALLEGGSAATSMRAELAANDAKQREYTATMGEGMGAIRKWAIGMLGTETTTEQATAAMEAQIAQMPPLEAAQARLTQAQTDYTVALRENGEASPEAAAALDQVRARSRDVEIAQLAVRENVDEATAAMMHQRDEMLEGLDANLRKRRADQQLARDQESLADAIRDHGAGSKEAADAQLQLETSQLRAAEAARESDGGFQAYTDTIRELVAQSEGELSPTLQGMVQSLDWAGLSAAGAQLKIDGAGRAVAEFPDGKTVVLDANTSAAVEQVNFVRDLVNQTHGTIGIDADPTLGVQKVGNFKLTTDSTTGVVTIDGNITPADQQRLGIQAKTDGTTGVMWIDGNPVPCDGKLNGARIRVDQTTGEMTIDADGTPADNESDRAHDHASQDQAFRLNADTSDAYRNSNSFFDWLWKKLANIPSYLGDFFTGGWNGGAMARGGVLHPMARGGVLGMAGGGGLTPMAGGTAAVVPPNTWRVIGDRMDVPESYIPHDRSERSRQILIDTARRMGFAVTPAEQVAMAAGGALTPAGAGSGGSGTAGGRSGGATGGGAPAAQPAGVGGQPLTPEQVAALEDATTGLTSATTAQQDADEDLAATQTGILIPALTTATSTAQEQVTTGLTPLTAAHTPLQAANQRTATVVGSSWQSNLAEVAGSNAGQQGQLNALAARLGGHQQEQAATSQYVGQAWAANTQNVGASVVAQQGYLQALNGALGVTGQAVGNFATGTGTQFARLQAAAANPIRYVIQGPMGGLVAAMNKINADFALGRPAAAPPVAAFAEGSEDHRAQIAGAGSPMRVWAEPETGGEAYIPLAPGKRDRSTGILAQVADRFGYRLEDRGGHPYGASGPDVRAFAEGGIVDPLWGPMLQPYFQPVYDDIDTVPARFPGNQAASLGADAARKRTDEGQKTTSEQLEKLLAAGVGGGVQRWAGMVNLALGMMGQPAAYAGLTLRRMNQESGGNPLAVNRYDINWQRGYPSVGLMQVIRPTYQANADARRDVGPYMYGVSVDPLSNTLASMHYALGRYGNLPAAYNKAGGYDRGGLADGAGTITKGPAPERVLDPRQTVKWEQLVDGVLDSAQGTGRPMLLTPEAVAELADVAGAGSSRSGGDSGQLEELRALRRQMSSLFEEVGATMRDIAAMPRYEIHPRAHQDEAEVARELDERRAFEMGTL